MRNGLLQSISSQLYSFGSNYEQAAQGPNLDVSTQMNSEGNLYSNGFCTKSILFNDDNLQLGSGRSALLSRANTYSYQPGYHSGTSSCADAPQQSMLLSKQPFVPQLEVAMPSARKRPIEVNDVLPRLGADMVGNTTAWNECKTNKRNKATISEQRQQYQARGSTMLTHIQEHGLQVSAVRRTQKLSDKITVLQKLVSPYGKTDTASVLQEASLYIKLLLEQIQNLSQMLSSSYRSVRAGRKQEIGEEVQVDLRSKGLCLVPASFTQKVKMESPADHHALWRKPIIHG